MQQRRRNKGIIRGLLSLSLLIGAGVLAGPALAQTTAPGPYYATPSWDQTLPSATRFIILSNFNSEAVLDRETGLVWERSPQTAPREWTNARSICTANTTGGRKGWRLPSVHELASLVDPTQTNPALPLGHPFTNVLPTFYWSATTTVNDPTAAWVVVFGGGGVGGADKGNSFQVWCLRGGMNAEAY